MAATVLKQGELAAGESYEVPASAAAPVLTTGKPEALRITVGSTQAPAIGEPGKTVSDVSLKAADLLRAPAGQAAAPPVQPASATRSRPTPPPAPRRIRAARVRRPPSRPRPATPRKPTALHAATTQ